MKTKCTFYILNNDGSRTFNGTAFYNEFDMARFAKCGLIFNAPTNDSWGRLIIRVIG